MLNYKDILNVRTVFYVVTIIFHAYMLVRAVLEGRYWVGAILLIPVTAISLALVRHVRKRAGSGRAGRSGN